MADENQDNKRRVRNDENDTIVKEHFWITATTLAVNGFIISHSCHCSVTVWLAIVSTVISLYAAFLIIERSAVHADKIHMPEELARIRDRDKSFLHKGLETIVRLTVSIKHLPFVVFDLSGAFFYLLLVIASCVGVWLLR